MMQKRKGFLHRVVAGDKNWIHCSNPKTRKSQGLTGHASTSSARPNIHAAKVMLCIWWDQVGIIYNELLKPNLTINGEWYQTQMMQFRSYEDIKKWLYSWIASKDGQKL